MIRSTRRRSPKRLAQEGREGDADIRAFLERELPPDERKQAAYWVRFLLEAGARYDRYTARRDEWRDYRGRKSRLEKITELAFALATHLSALDILTRDDLARRDDMREIESLLGSLVFLGRETQFLANSVQKDGRPRDLAEERWILEAADIYENAFRRRASIWGSGAGKVKQRGNFYSLLELSRPKSFPRYGKLNPRQIDRILKRRNRRGLEFLFGSH